MPNSPNVKDWLTKVDIVMDPAIPDEEAGELIADWMYNSVRESTLKECARIANNQLVSASGYLGEFKTGYQEACVDLYLKYRKIINEMDNG